jgi:hypothetical protein
LTIQKQGRLLKETLPVKTRSRQQSKAWNSMLVPTKLRLQWVLKLLK